MKVEALKKELGRLEKFIGSREFYEKQEILDWVAECVAMFSSLGIDSNIISSFIGIFSFQNSELGPSIDVSRIGPFIVFEMDPRSGGRNINWSKYRMDKWVSVEAKNFFYANIAFTTARRILEGKEDEERLVPKALVTVLSENENYSHIVSSLELMQKSFEEKNADSVLKNSITLLESILDLEPTLKSKDSLATKIRTLNTDKNIFEKFGVHKEFLFAFDNNRIIRNFSTHKDSPRKHDVPFLVAVGCAYLVVTFLERTMNVGELIS